MISDIIAIARRLAGMIKRLQRRQALSASDREYVTRLLSAANETPPAPSTLPVFDSIASASGATGIPLGVLKAAKRQGCPAFSQSRLRLDELLRWMFSSAQVWPKAAETDWGQELKKWLAKRAAILATRELAQVVTVAQAQREIRLGVEIAFSELDAMVARLDGRLAGKDEAEIAALLRNEADRLRDVLRERFQNAA